MANVANPSETNPIAPGYKNPITGAINPGYPASSVPFGPAPFSQGGPDPTYSTATTYTKGQAVTFDGKRYVSLINSNTANAPNANPVSWSAPPVDELAPGSVEDLWANISTQFTDMKKKDAEFTATLHQLAVKTNQSFHS
jgi:hypothetical protein